MELQLDEAECEALREVLQASTGDLSYEISNTDRSSFKDDLKSKRDLLVGILERLGGPAT